MKMKIQKYNTLWEKNERHSKLNYNHKKLN